MIQQAKNPANSAEKHSPAMLIAGEPLPIAYLQTLGATTGQVPTYNGTTVVWDTPAIVPGEISLATGLILVGSLLGKAAPVAMSGDVNILYTGATAVTPGAISTGKIANKAVTGAKLSTGVGYFSVTVLTNGTTPVNVLGATTPCAVTITGISAISADATGVALTIAQTLGTVATLTSPASAGGMIGADSLANAGVASGATLTVVGGAAHNAFVTITFTTA